MENRYAICHYDEIGLKGKNRKFFEERLIQNIEKVLQSDLYKVKRISGRILIILKEGCDENHISKQLLNVFGIANFSFAVSCEQNIDIIREKAVQILEAKSFQTFKIDCSRSNKEIALTSQGVNEKVGEEVLQKLTKKVRLKDPDITLFIELVEKYCFLFTEKIEGLRGLPVSVSGKAVSLISGGIDSPVASFYAMKRGIRLVFCHFHALPYVNKFSIDKVRDLVKILDKYQFDSKLYLVPFADIQKQILLHTKEKLRVVLYRRMMLRIAREIAEKEKARVLVTGENVGQVASQTLPNLSVIDKATDSLSLKPLITDSKIPIFPPFTANVLLHKIR